MYYGTHIGTEMNASQFGFKTSKVKVTMELKYTETALSGLLTRCLEKYWSDFHQTYTNDVLWGRGESIKFWGHNL